MNARSKWACIFSLQTLVNNGWAYLWTLTTPDEVDLTELSQRWRKLIWNGFTPCVRVFEKHPGGHGYHVHFVTATRLKVEDLRPKAKAAGFGRIHVKRIPASRAVYVAKYLTKQRSTARGVRLWSCVGFVGSKAKNINMESTEWDDLKFIMSRYPAPAGYNFTAVLNLAKKRLGAFMVEVTRRDGDPHYEPSIPSLYRLWKNNPLNSVGKPPHWWHLATTHGVGTAAAWWESLRPTATVRDKAQHGVDGTALLPLE